MSEIPPVHPPPSGSPPPPPPPYSPGIQPASPPRDPIVALLLNIFFFCAGYFFIGQMQKGFVALIIFLFQMATAFGLGLVSAGCSTCLVLPIALAMNAVTAIDAYLQAQQLKSGQRVGEWTFFNAHL